MTHAVAIAGGSIALAGCTVSVLRVPVAEPLRTSFGVMTDRPAVLVSLSDHDGNTGWGEVWCNFPSVGAEHRARLVETEIFPLLLQRSIDHPRDMFDYLTQELHLLVNQTGESGPIAQAIAGVDIALWDLVAQRQSQPLWQLLGGTAACIPCYASGINPGNAAETAAAHYQQGYRAFKLKVGFNDDLDVANANAIRSTLGNDVPLMLDANQAWNPDQARRMTARLADANPLWIEEPLPVDAPLQAWQQLAKDSPIALAGGENLRGYDDFRAAIDSRLFSYIQPDAAKWGGVTGCLDVAVAARDAGICYCPHWLGGAVGLMASAHLLAASGSTGMLEVDGNPNPLRDKLAGPLPELASGRWTLSARAGHGAVPQQAVCRQYAVSVDGNGTEHGNTIRDRI